MLLLSACRRERGRLRTPRTRLHERIRPRPQLQAQAMALGELRQQRRGGGQRRRWRTAFLNICLGLPVDIEKEVKVDNCGSGSGYKKVVRKRRCLFGRRTVEMNVLVRLLSLVLHIMFHRTNGLGADPIWFSGATV